MKPDLQELNAAQYRAVTFGTKDPLLVLAGPGSGKTHTLIKRVLYLIDTCQVPPEEIVVLTFTKAAAMELRERFQKACGLRIVPVCFGTFHSFFFTILKEASALQADHLLSESRKREILSQIIKEVMQKEQTTAQRMTPGDTTDFLAAISYLKNTGDMEGAKRKLSIWQESFFDEIYRQYEAKKRRGALFDFDDMLSACLRLLQTDHRRLLSWRERLHYILLDEFQDINPVQYEIIKLLGEKQSVFAVGDDDQSIYGFRGASPDCIRRFAEDFGAQRVVLAVNYRSTPAIVAASLHMISENTGRYEKQLRSAQSMPGGGGKVRLRACLNVGEQMEAILQEAARFDKEAPEQTMAILFRTNAGLRKMAASLKRAGIAFSMREKTQSIYEHFVVKDLFSYLSLAYETESMEHLLRIINKPSRFVSREAMAACQSLKELTAYYAARPGRGQSVCAHLETLQKHLEKLRSLPIALAVPYLCKAVGYERYLAEYAGHRFWELQEWLELTQWLIQEARAYSSFAQWKSLAGESPKEAPKKADKDCRLQIMTVHASKGLEFDQVLLPDCNERNFPYGQMLEASALEEERRIFYVGMTRAKKSLELLYLTGTSKSPRQPSRFLDPIRREAHQIHSCQEIRRMPQQPCHIPRHHR